MILREYQEDISSKAALSLKDCGIAYLAMECRTGKSITAYSTIKKAGYKKALVVTKNKAMSGLMADYSHFTLDFQASFITYGSLHKVVGEFDVVLIDEAHSLGAFPKPSDRTKNLQELIKGLPVIYLSGTPTPESFSQIYHQLWVSSFSPFKEKSFYAWARTYVNKKTKMIQGRSKNDYSDAYEDMIGKRINKFMFSLTQQEAGFDVSIREEFIHCQLSKSQQFLIKKIQEDHMYEGKTGEVVIADTAVKMQQKFHQICSGTLKLDSGKRVVLSDNKGQAIKEELGDKNIAIFYKFIAELEMLKATFPNWTTDPEEFQNSKDLVYLGQFVSSREGVRLDTADAIVFLNIDFSYLSYAQARERIVSKERIEEAVLYWVFSYGGIEEKIYSTVMKKKNYTSYHFKRDYGFKKK